MSDSKDSQNGKSDPFSQLTDMESTVRIDFSAHPNVASTSDDTSPIDFEQTLDGLTDIDEILKNDEVSDHSIDEPTVSFSTDEIDFDELDAGINALSDEFSESDKPQDEKLDDLDSFLDDDDSDDIFDTDRTVTLDSFDNDEEPVAEVSASDNTFDDWPLLNDDDGEDDLPVADPLLDASGEFDMPDLATDDEEPADTEETPVIELTEEMLDEPDSTVSDEFDLSEEENAEEHSDTEDAPAGSLDSISETPELTTTETNILSGATEAIHKIVEEEEKKMQEADYIKEPIGQNPVTTTPVESKNSGTSSALPAMLAMLGIAAGGFGAWMAWDANNRVADLESQIRNLQAAKANTADRQSIADMQQRLTKVERRLTGTPTIEAAATLGETPVESTSGTTATEAESTATQEMMSVARSNKPVAKAITPATKMEQPQSVGDWVVNLSSHVKESAAANEKARLIKMGLNAEVHSATIKNKIWYRVQIIGFATKNEAKAQLRDIQQRSGIQGAWVGKK